MATSEEHSENDPFNMALKSDEEIVDMGLRLARMFYFAHGYQVPEGYKFYDASHPQEVGMWNLAVIAFEELTGTDLNDALSNIEYKLPTSARLHLRKIQIRRTVLTKFRSP